MKRKFVYQDEQSHKFWDIEITGNQFTVTYGKAGTQGQTQTKQFTTEEECQKAAQKLIEEKLKKGYNGAMPLPVSGHFSPPAALYSDLLAMGSYLLEHHKEEVEIVKATTGHIVDMEKAAGFDLPDAFVDYWYTNGSLFLGKDDFIYVLYCYNAEGVNGNNLHGYLDFWGRYYRRSFSLLSKEKAFLLKCFWVLGMISQGEEMWVFVSDPTQTIRIIHFSEILRSIAEEKFEQALHPVLDTKGMLKATLGATAFDALLNSVEPDDAPGTETPETSAPEDAATDGEAAAYSYLEKYGIKETTYAEALALLKVDELFDYWDGENEHYASDDYETEREYFEANESIFICNGDLTVDGDFRVPGFDIGLLIVHGNMTIHGKIDAEYGHSMQYYVSGNTTVDYLKLGHFQKTAGTETIRYVASAWGEDDETAHTLPYRTINAPYFFSWYYSLNCFEFAPTTVITALYDYDLLTAYETDNTILRWHEYAYVFREELCYSLESSNYSMLNIEPEKVYKALKNNEPVIREGVTPEAIKLVEKGLQLKKEDDTVGAYLSFKEAIAKGPGYYPAYKQAGACLNAANAYAQAKAIYAKGIPLTPASVLYELECMEKGALCALQTKEYDQAIAWASQAVEHNAAASFSLRVIGEALLLQHKPEEAKSYLERSIAIRSIFSNNWLLGLIYHQQGDAATAESYFATAKEKNEKAQPYTTHTDLHYIYGDNVTVDWDSQKGPQVKDQAYWNQYFTDMLAKYGPDMYKRMRVWPTTWLVEKLGIIPKEYRSIAMLQQLLDHTTKAVYDVDGRVIVYFNPEELTPALVLQAVKRNDPVRYEDIPARLMSAAIYDNHPHGIDLLYVPKADWTYELCFRAVTESQYNYKAIPAAFKDERMTIALIAGGGLGEYPVQPLPSKYRSIEYLQQAIDLDIEVIERIPVELLDEEVYAYAVAKFGQHPRWPFIVEKYDRNRWRYGAMASDVEVMGRLVQQHGMEVFDHIDIDHINARTFGYYKKHLGHLPGFEEKVDQYGWRQAATVADSYDEPREFDYETFRKVWPCFWDEAFILQAISGKDSDSRDKISHVPAKYLTQKICEKAVEHDQYSLIDVPRHMITPEMCEQACAPDYSTMLEYVPIAMRTEALCRLSVGNMYENIKFVPVALRQPYMFVNVVKRNMHYRHYIPHNQYASVFELIHKEYKDYFNLGDILVNWGLGFILLKQYEEARTKLTAAEKTPGIQPHNRHQALYYTGWSYFLEGDAAKAKEYYRLSQELAKAEKIDSEDRFDHAYAEFALPQVPEVYEFSQREFDQQLQEASLLVQTKHYPEALALLEKAEQLLTDAQCSEMRLWAYVWDHQRYALYEVGNKDASLSLCRRIIDELSKITLWDYLEEFNSIRGALRSAHNSLAYHIYETATDLKGLKEGIKHIKTTMKTIAPIEDKAVLNYFYETQALLYHKAAGFDDTYHKELEKVMTKINKLQLKEEGLLSEHFIALMQLDR